MDELDITRVQQIINSYEEQIRLNAARIEKFGSYLAKLQKDIRSALVRIVASSDAAIAKVKLTAENYKAAEPEGYDDLVNAVNSLKNVQDKTLVPFIVNLQMSGFNNDSWTSLNDKISSVQNLLESKITDTADLTPIILGLVKPTDGNTIATKVPVGISLIRMLFSDDIRSVNLSGVWSQGEGKGSGILSDDAGSAYLVTEEGDNVKIKMIESTASQDTVFITPEELEFIKALASTGISVKEITDSVSAVSSFSGISSIPVILVGTTAAVGGADKILQKTNDGLQLIKINLDGVTMAGPWTREGTYGYGILQDSGSNLWNVHLAGNDIIAKNIGDTGSLVENNIVSADITSLISMIKDLENATTALLSPDSKISKLEKKINSLETVISPIVETVDDTFTRRLDFENLVTTIGTQDKVEGKNLLQLIFSLQHDINSLKSTLGLEPSADIPDSSSFNYDAEAVNEQHKILLKIIRNIVTASTTGITGDALFIQGLLAVTTQSLVTLKSNFVDGAVWSDSVTSFLNSFGINLSTAGSILGDINLSNTNNTLLYPVAEYEFKNGDITYPMRFVTKEGVTFFVQHPDELSSNQRETMRKVICWFAPESLKLVEKLLSLSVNSSTSTLSKIKLELGTFDKKCLVIVFNGWTKGSDITVPKATDTVTVSFPTKENDKATSVVFDINSNYYSQVTGDNGTGDNDAPISLATAICHAIVTATMATNVKNYDSLPLWLKEGILYLATGPSDIIKADIKELFASRLRLEKAFSALNRSDYELWENANDSAAAGYFFLRYILWLVDKAQQEQITPADNLLSQGARRIKNMISKMASSQYLISETILDEGLSSITTNFATARELCNSFTTALRKSINKRESYATFLERECNIILFNEDDGSILGYDAGSNQTIKVEDIVLEDQTSDITYPTNIVHFGGYPTHFKYVDGVLYLFPDITTVTEDKKKVLALISSKILSAAVNIIKTTTGLSLNRISKGLLKDDDGDIKVYGTPFIFVSFNDDIRSPYTLDDHTPVKANYTINVETLKADSVTLTINTKYFDKIVDGNSNGLSVAYPDIPYLDILILQELTKATLAVNLAGNEYPLWFTNGFAKMISGADKELTNSLESVLSSVERTETALHFDPSFNSFVDINDPGTVGYALLRYLVQQTA